MPRGSPDHSYCRPTGPGQYVAPAPAPNYYPDSSQQVAHLSPANANEIYPKPYTGPGVLMDDPTPPTDAIPEAPADGTQYGRQNLAWTPIVAGTPGPAGPAGPQGDPGPAGPAGTGGSPFANGTTAAPSIAFASEPALGFYRKSAGILGASGIMVLSSTAANGQLSIDKPTGAWAAVLKGTRAGSSRWTVTLGDASAESSNSGSDFTIQRHNDAGTPTGGVSLSISRINGNVTAQGLTLQQDTDELRERLQDLSAKLETALARIATLETPH